MCDLCVIHLWSICDLSVRLLKGWVANHLPLSMPCYHPYHPPLPYPTCGDFLSPKWTPAGVFADISVRTRAVRRLSQTSLTLHFVVPIVVLFSIVFDRHRRVLPSDFLCYDMCSIHTYIGILLSVGTEGSSSSSSSSRLCFVIRLFMLWYICAAYIHSIFRRYI